LSINPIHAGHALVVPVAEVDHWLDLPADDVAHLMAVSQRVGQAQMRAYRCARIAVIIAGFEVPHCHIHVIPADDMGDLSFARAANASPAELAEQASLLEPFLR
jgi:histidine triad (HIT) family protein